MNEKFAFETTSARGFTLVEMLVVMAIIALLLAALLPAFSSVRNSARVAQTKANFTALDTGISSFRAEQALGGGPPPSSSDNKDKPQEIANPAGTSDGTTLRVAGAHLLVMAMIGGDSLGTPGFKDIDNDGTWWDNTHKGDKDGIYYLDPTSGKEKYPRYGGGGYVDEKMRERAKSLKDLADKGKILNAAATDPLFRGDAPLSVFTDSWDTPILYYKATPASNRMISDMKASPPALGIYRQEDNGVITGTVDGQTAADGYDFGSGKIDGTYHAIAKAKSPAVTDKVEDILTDDATWANTFARYILDPKTKVRPTPVLKDSYLLISAGPDGRYGTPDDVGNWERETN